MKVMLRFGPAGMPIKLKGKSLVDGLKYCINNSLYAFEIEWVRGVKVKKGIEEDIKKIVKSNDVLLSAHAPYWINPCSDEKRIKDITFRNLKECAIAASKLNVEKVVFHPGYYGKDKEKARKNAIEFFKEFFEWEKENGLNIIFAPETTGKISQYGNIDEVIELCKKFKLMVPCIDFAHIHARGNGCIKTKDDYEKIINKIKDELGKKYLENLHIHFSGIKYNKNGEIEHLPIKSKSPDFDMLAKLIVEKNYAFTIISESPLLDIDAIEMLNIIKKIKK
ncbi:MAG: TIM barrel protein [Candidatus Pacearchaeota archaeon]